MHMVKTKEHAATALQTSTCSAQKHETSAILYDELGTDFPFNLMIKCGDREEGKETRTRLSVATRVSWEIQGDFFQTSSHLTLYVCWSCPV